MLFNVITTPMTFWEVLIIILCAVALGILNVFVFSFKKRMTTSLSLALSILPTAMTAVILLANGNLGIAVALIGGFSLVRFRSVEGTGREIAALFVSMIYGIICGTGYIILAFVFFGIISVLVIVLTLVKFGESHTKLFKITVPEDYDYTHLFDEVFAKYNAKAEVVRVRTLNLGSVFEVSYAVTLTGDVSKEMLDEIRTLNANLAIVVTNFERDHDSL